MSFEKWQELWRDQPMRGDESAARSAERIAGVRKAAGKFPRAILWRDVREVAAAFLVSGVFGYVAWQAGREGSQAWPAWIAAALPLGVAAFFLVDRMFSRKRGLSRGETVRAELMRALDDVQHQAWLLRRVLWWYILPLFLASVFFVLQLVLFAPVPLAVKIVVAVLGLVPGVIASLWVRKLNQKALRTELEPRIHDLETCLRELNAVPDEEDSRSK